MAIRLAFSNLAAPDWTIDRALAAVGEYGYDALELRLLDGEPIDATALDVREQRAIKAALVEAGVPLASLDTSIVLAHAFEDELRAALELAHFLEAPSVRVFGGEPDGEGALETIADRLAPVLATAEREGVSVALETHDGFSSAALVAALLARVESPWFVALWDVHHTYRMGESPDEVVRLLGDRIAQVHVKDARHDENGEFELVLLGDGDVPVAESLTALASAQWDGFVSVEWEKCWYPELPEPDVALPQHAALLRHWLTERPAERRPSSR